MAVQFEALQEGHAREVMDIFNFYIAHGFAAYPETALPESFFGKLLEMTAGYPAFAMKDAEGGGTIGFCFLRPYNPFATFKKTAEITYFIKPDFTGRGLGAQALARLELEAKGKGIRFLLASISSKNEMSLAFHKKNGFWQCGNFKNIGEKRGEPFSVVWMQKELE